MVVERWEDLFELYQQFFDEASQRWVFRGTRRARLLTSLEKAAAEFETGLERLPQIERGLVRQFARHYAQYGQHIPEPDNYLEWFAIMQHYGAPTRLLDFSYSFYVALFFALEGPQTPDAPPDQYEARLWAVALSTLEERLGPVIANSQAGVREAWRADPALAKYRTFNAVFLGEHPADMVAMVNPYRRNERLTLQQGVFLCPGNLQKSFGDNLRAVLPDDDSACRQIGLRLTRTARSEILMHLNNMNMNHATLFPGLEGLARSLRIRLAAEGTLLYAPDVPRPLEP